VLDSERTPEEQWGPVVTPKEIAALMGLLDRAGVPTDTLKQHLATTYGVQSRKELRRGHLLALAKWIADEAERRAGAGA
jgi:hypothetical protein